MMRATTLALALFATIVSAFVGRLAWAEPPDVKATSVYVLSIWTEDADDQADALTQAVRARVRQVQGWSLLESNQSFETLAIALKCPAKPDPPCLQRMADQLHADRFIWGTMEKKKRSPGEVIADLHLWTRGGGDVDATETFSDKLKDPAADPLRAIAASLFARLTGAGSATLVVHADARNGTVLVDGIDKAALDSGIARVDIPPGEHTVAVRAPGVDDQTQTTNATMGTEQHVTFARTPLAGDEPPRPFPTRKVVEYSAIGIGSALVLAAGIEGLQWLSDKNQSSDDRKNVPRSVTDVCALPIVNASAQDACDKSKDAVAASTLGWVFAGIGGALVGAGVWLIATERGPSAKAPPTETSGGTANRRYDVVPSIGTRSGAIAVRVTF